MQKDSCFKNQEELLTIHIDIRRNFVKTSNIIRIVTLILLIITIALFFIPTNEWYFRISSLTLLIISLSYPHVKNKEEKNC